MPVTPDVSGRAPRVPARVVLLNWRDTTNPEGGGSERYVEQVAAGFAESGSDVTVVCARHERAPAEEVRGGVRFVRVGSKLSVYPRAMAWLRRARLGPADLVIDVQNGVPFWSPLVTRAPVVVLVHHVHREQWHVVYGQAAARVGWYLESRVAPRVYRGRQYVTVSTASRAELVGLGVDPAQVALVHNGADPAGGPVAATAPEPTVVVLGRLVPHKQVEHVLDAVGDLRHRHPGLRLDVVGDGWWADRLHTHAAGLGLGDAVAFHGEVDEATKHRLLARAWVLAVPSLKEGWGLVVLEAAAHGVPAVGYRSAGGLTESVVDGHTGLLVDGGAAELTAALDTLLTDHERRRAMGAAARARSGQFSWARTRASFRAVAAAVLDGRTVAAVEEPARRPTTSPVVGVGVGAGVGVG